MKKQMNILRRLKVCWVYFKTVDSHFLGEYCPYCYSHRIKNVDPQDTYSEMDNSHVYTSTYVCMSCGAVADTKETWSSKPSVQL